MNQAPKKSEVKPRLWLIDASIYFFRYYFTLGDFCFDAEGQATTASYGYCQWLLKFLTAEKTDAVAVCFDESLETCFRNEIYSEYKSSRVLPDENISFQFQACKKFTQLCGIETFASTLYEADDLIASLAEKAVKRGFDVTVVSRDKDLSQVILNEGDRLWDYPDGLPQDMNELASKQGVNTNQVASLLALTGDSIDDIPGVPGVGRKTAAALLQHFEGWPQMRVQLHSVENLPLRGAKNLAKKLVDYRDQIDIAFQLTSLKRDVAFSATSLRKRKNWLKSCPPDFSALDALVEELGYKRNILSLLNKWKSQFPEN